MTKEGTLCWDCDNACAKGCSWAAEAVPVDGWKAEETVVDKGRVGRSFMVYDCPQFVPDGTHLKAEDLDTDGCVRLLAKCLELTRMDYVNCPELRSHITRWIMESDFFALCLGLDPDAVISTLRRAAKREDMKHIRMRRNMEP